MEQKNKNVTYAMNLEVTDYSYPLVLSNTCTAFVMAEDMTWLLVASTLPLLAFLARLPNVARR